MSAVLKSVKLNSPKGAMGSVEVEWSDGEKKVFVYPWLRDHCMCSGCYHPKTLQRLVDTFKIPLDVKPFEATIDAVTNSLSIVWTSTDDEPEKHRSAYPSEYLRSGEPAAYFRPVPPQRLWGSEIAKKLPELSYDEIINGGHEAMRRLVSTVLEYGVAFVRGVPQTSEDTEDLLQRLGHIRHTIFGGFWEFTPNLAVNDTAYTTLELHAHTDGTYFQDPPGLECFHLLEHRGTGGRTRLVDGFKVARELQQHEPEAFRFLCETKLPFHYIDEKHGHHYYQERTVFSVGPDGRANRMSFNNDDRAHFEMSPAQTEQFYKALRALQTALRDPRHELLVQLEPGTTVIVNNWRVLHGRTAFSGHRKMVGCYIGMEDFMSRWFHESEVCSQNGHDASNGHVNGSN